MALKANRKGSAGEREFCKWAFENLDFLEEPVQRELGQARDGGADVILEPWLIVEVKRRETLDLQNWWFQVQRAANKRKAQGLGFLYPVVAFRQNQKPWEFLIPATFIGLDRGYMRVTQLVFKRWVNEVVTIERD